MENVAEIVPSPSFSCKPELIRKEFSILLNRLYKVGVDCNIEAINVLMKIILEKWLEYLKKRTAYDMIIKLGYDAGEVCAGGVFLFDLRL